VNYVNALKGAPALVQKALEQAPHISSHREAFRAPTRIFSFSAGCRFSRSHSKVR